ncbi:uncharacterized protein DNG_00789 [Cephalotrichum gorgonifer]|uniref:small monomeric GTPase n=1 Tax=Cephalotrichum gorgonifer TaxID=2041049 RepID=A0AAE8MRC9_9PEZI|nr:uncharacterized protein DNG_00789 [Cephalotrichum gorgonifer]
MAVARGADSPESIIVWTEEEKRYLRRMLSLDFLSSGEEIRRALTVRRMNGAGLGAARKPAGEFRILVLGAKGTGKTSLLTRICHNRFPNPDPTGVEAPQSYRTTADIDSQLYTFDVLELPSQNLWRNDLVQQAIGITDAALLLYSTSDLPSLHLARGLADLIAETVITSNREYSILLAGNKSDAGAEERTVAYSEGSRVAGAFAIKTSFMEVSAVSGDQAGLVLPKLGRDVLLLRGISEQRREYAEKVRREAELATQGAAQGQQVAGVRKKLGLWKRISRPFFLRREVAQV